MKDTHTTTPILRHKYYDEPSTFTPANLLREAQRQKGVPAGPIPDICILDPDGDILRHLCTAGRAQRNPYWACYHTDLYNFEYAGRHLGIVGCAVGASFAVLIAEEMFASGCRLLISMTSAGQITPQGAPPYFVLIERALRDEGASYHYLPPSDYAHLDADLHEHLRPAFRELPQTVYCGATWTTDAPFRETQRAIDAAREAGIFAVEMEAAALYAFAAARRHPVVCIAHVTNQMATIEGDFKKGEAAGSRDALQVIAAAAQALKPTG